MSRHLPVGVLSDQRPHRQGSEGDDAPASGHFYMVGGNSRKATANHNSGGSHPVDHYHIGQNYHCALAFTDV